MGIDWRVGCVGCLPSHAFGRPSLNPIQKLPTNEHVQNTRGDRRKIHEKRTASKVLQSSRYQRASRRRSRGASGAKLVQGPPDEGGVLVEADGDLLEEGVGLQASEDEVEGLPLRHHVRHAQHEIIRKDGRDGGGGEGSRIELAARSASLVEGHVRAEGEALALPALERTQQSADRLKLFPIADAAPVLASKRRSRN